MAVDIEKFNAHLRTNALTGFGLGICATKVREALEAAGANTTGHPRQAKNYGHLLRVNGYRIVSDVSTDNRKARPGDIAVIDAAKTGSSAGHIQGWDGQNWISDFVQQGFWPGHAYRKDPPDYDIYRLV